MTQSSQQEPHRPDDPADSPRPGRWLRTVLKVALAAGAVWLVGAGLAQMGGGTDVVREAAADIADLTMTPRSKQQRFVESLQDMGMSEPRSFDYNGNTLFFSHGSSRLSPEQLLVRFQDKFVENGVNRHFHNTVETPGAPGKPTAEQVGQHYRKNEGFVRRALERRELPDPTEAGMGAPPAVRREYAAGQDFLTGGLVPVEIGEDRVAMVGVESKSGAQDLIGVYKEMVNNPEMRSPADIMGSFRFVEAFRKPGQAKTHIVAAWSDDKLDMNRHRPGERNYTDDPAELIPVCLSCKPVNRIAGYGADKNNLTLTFESPNPPAHELAFYNRVMRERGWQPDPALESVSRLRRRFGYGGPIAEETEYASFHRDGVFATLLIYRDQTNRRTYVKWMVSK